MAQNGWYARVYLKTDHWQQVKADITHQRNNRCEHCGNCNRLQVHHRYYRDQQGNSILFREQHFPDSLKLLCADCHSNEHSTWDEILRKLKR